MGRIRRGVTAAREQAQAAAADMESVRLSLHAELAMDYFALRSADAQIQLLQDTVKAYHQALQLTQDRYEGGIAPQSDVTQARTQLDDAQVQLTDLHVQRAHYEHAIAVLVGEPPATLTLPAIPLNENAPTLPTFRGWCRQPCCSAVLTLQLRNAKWLRPTKRLALQRLRSIPRCRWVRVQGLKAPRR